MKELQELKHGDVFSTASINTSKFLFLRDITKKTNYAVCLTTGGPIDTSGTVNMNDSCMIKAACVHYNLFEVINNAEAKMKHDKTTTKV